MMYEKSWSQADSSQHTLWLCVCVVYRDQFAAANIHNAQKFWLKISDTRKHQPKTENHSWFLRIAHAQQQTNEQEKIIPANDVPCTLHANGCKCWNSIFLQTKIQISGTYQNHVCILAFSVLPRMFPIVVSHDLIHIKRYRFEIIEFYYYC